MNVLMVCLGNICRSPIAEGVLKSKFESSRITGKVDSAGVISYHAGESPDSRAIKIALENGIDITRQIARQFRPSDFDEFDIILTMDSSVHNEIVALAKTTQHAGKVKLFMEFAGNRTVNNVPDPYYGGRDGFENVFKLIDMGCESITQTLLQSRQ